MDKRLDNAPTTNSEILRQSYSKTAGVAHVGKKYFQYCNSGTERAPIKISISFIPPWLKNNTAFDGGAIMAGLALLRVAPLLSATSSLTFTLSEDTFIRPLIHENSSTAATEARRHVNNILPSHSRWTQRGLAIIFITYPLSIATAAANLARQDAHVDISTGASYNARVTAGFYLAGLLFSVLHFPFGPSAMTYLKRVAKNTGKEGDAKMDNTASMVAWLRINLVRGVVADLPSWACYLVAFMSSMR
jgi:hypothetical protein